MKLDGKDIKTMTKEEIENFMKDIENSPLFRSVMEGLYGSVGNLKDLISEELEDVRKEENKELSKETEEENIQNPFITVKEKDNISKERNNIGKKCKIYGHEDIRDGREGIIQDIVELTQSYVININSNIVYASFNQVKIIEDWEDIEIKGYNKELGNYIILIKEDNITVEIFCNVWRNEDEDTYNLDLDKTIQDKLVSKLETEEYKVVEFVLAKVKSMKIKKEHERACDEVIAAREKRNELANEFKVSSKDANSLLEGLM